MRFPRISAILLLLLIFSGCSAAAKTSGAVPFDPEKLAIARIEAGALTNIPEAEASMIEELIRGKGGFHRFVSICSPGDPGFDALRIAAKEHGAGTIMIYVVSATARMSKVKEPDSDKLKDRRECKAAVEIILVDCGTGNRQSTITGNAEEINDDSSGSADLRELRKIVSQAAMKKALDQVAEKMDSEP
ncbi:MAG: hypothetical protein ACYS8W_00030 [Planctomycetota bacterium]|jgi:hypothetical protein